MTTGIYTNSPKRHSGVGLSENMPSTFVWTCTSVIHADCHVRSERRRSWDLLLHSGSSETALLITKRTIL